MTHDEARALIAEGRGHDEAMHGRRHGHTTRRTMSPTYRSWISMRSRCNNPNAASYKWYGGKGVSVCDRWNSSFDDFLCDMGERPAGTSIDRIDNEGNYEPENCRWATQAQQSHNRQNPRKVTDDDILQIRRMHQHGVLQRDIAGVFHISPSLVRQIVRKLARFADAPVKRIRKDKKRYTPASRKAHP